jgi:hypothetical protein
MMKLAARERAQLVVIACQAGLLRPARSGQQQEPPQSQSHSGSSQQSQAASSP